MMIVRPAAERGHANHGWLDSWHSFSFADYYDPQYMGFRSLRVINEDWVKPGEGFPTHPHKDMEIITYVLDGLIAHKDSMGTGSTIKPGDVQRMSAGTGVTHSEFNASDEEELHLLQIWLLPASKGIRPSYEQKTFSEADKRGKLKLVASTDGREGSITVHQDVALYAGLFSAGEQTNYELGAGRHAWIQVARGQVKVNGKELKAGDGAAISDEKAIKFEGVDQGEVLLFDLA